MLSLSVNVYRCPWFSLVLYRPADRYSNHQLIITSIAVYVLRCWLVRPILTFLFIYTQGESEKSSPLRFSGIFHKRLGIFRPNFTSLLYVPIYYKLQIFIQLSPTLMKLCHVKRHHPVHIVSAKCPPLVKTHSGIFWRFFPSSWEFLVQILHAYYTFLSTLEYNFFI